MNSPASNSGGPASEMSDPRPLPRYARQARFAPIGEQGQAKIQQGRVLICGCGALGSVLANTLGRAGVGRLRLVDRDFVEITNLQRQVLYDERDVEEYLPKAVAAASKLALINSEIEVEPIVTDVNADNVLELCRDVDVILDGTDNFETRFLINDVAHELGIPWVYGGCIGAEGQTMTVLPGKTACLRCLMPEVPPAGSTPTCDTAGIVGSVINVIASIQALEALKILVEDWDAINPCLAIFELWENRFRQVRLDGLRDQTNCPTCKQGDFPWLRGEKGSQSTALCGRNAVQVSPGQVPTLSLEQLAEKLRGLGDVSSNRYLLRFAVDGYQLTIFPDGRAIVGGTEDIGIAKSVYAKYIGY